MTRDDRQARVLTWARDTFGEVAVNPTERVSRFVEEAIELAQACGYPPERIVELVGYTYGRPPGEVGQEVGGVSVSLLALCESLGISAEVCEARETERVTSITREVFRRKHQAKVEAGVAEPMA